MSANCLIDDSDVDAGVDAHLHDEGDGQGAKYVDFRVFPGHRVVRVIKMLPLEVLGPCVIVEKGDQGLPLS